MEIMEMQCMTCKQWSKIENGHKFCQFCGTQYMQNVEHFLAVKKDMEVDRSKYTVEHFGKPFLYSIKAVGAIILIAAALFYLLSYLLNWKINSAMEVMVLFSAIFIFLWVIFSTNRLNKIEAEAEMRSKAFYPELYNRSDLKFRIEPQSRK